MWSLRKRIDLNGHSNKQVRASLVHYHCQCSSKGGTIANLLFPSCGPHMHVISSAPNRSHIKIIFPHSNTCSWRNGSKTSGVTGLGLKMNLAGALIPWT